MKVLKKIFYVLAGLLLAACAFVLICALNPALSQKISVFLYGNEDQTGFTQIFKKGGFSEFLNNKWGVELPDGIDDAVLPDILDDLPEYSVGTLPDGVGMLTGYQPVDSIETLVSEETAKELRDELGTGDTGSALSFDVSMYPYYDMLDETEAAVYKQIYANACAIKSSFAPTNNIDTKGLKRAFEAVVNDHPELFYLETEYSVKYDKAGKVVEITLSYYTIVNDLASAKNKFNAAANGIIAGASELATDYDKEKYVHDALVASTVYDDTAPMGQSAYSALVNGKTVCAGYARANQYILQQLGIPCYYCVGYSGQNHAWNIVGLSDGFYNSDVTWDDTVPPTYDYFNRTDSDFALSHVRTGMSLNLPKCQAFTYRGLESGAVAEVEIPDGTTVDGNQVHMTPLHYDDIYGKTDDPTDEEKAHALLVEKLAEIGLKESDVSWSMDEYYTKCKNDLISAGTGDKHYAVIIPESLFPSVEKAYSTDEYKTKYADEALQKLGMNKMSIQIQAQRLGNGYYKLYHNVYTWKE